MIDKERIIIMTKLAIYDKKYGEADRKASSFFRHDYIYWKNFWVRLYAFLGCVMVAAVYAFNEIFVEGREVFKIDYFEEGKQIGIMIIAVLVFYTVVSSFIWTGEYSIIQRRIDYSLKLTKKLDSLNAKNAKKAKEETPEGDSLIYYGNSVRNKRNGY